MYRIRIMIVKKSVTKRITTPLDQINLKQCKCSERTQKQVLVRLARSDTSQVIQTHRISHTIVKYKTILMKHMRKLVMKMVQETSCINGRRWNRQDHMKTSISIKLIYFYYNFMMTCWDRHSYIMSISFIILIHPVLNEDGQVQEKFKSLQQTNIL